MEFDAKRFLKLAGISDEGDAKRPDGPALQPRSATRTLTESARRPVMSSDEQKLRSLIRREAQKMISERATRAGNPSIEQIQQRKSLTEAIVMGFAGIGFGSNRGVLGGPMTSASRFASLDESETNEGKDGDGLHEDDEARRAAAGRDSDLSEPGPDDEV